MRSLPIALSLLAAAPLPATAGIRILSTQRQSHVPTDGGTLKRWELVKYEKRVTLPGDTLALASYMTDVRMVLETAGVADITSYGVVQYIRGCQFHSRYEGGAVTKTLDISRDHFGERSTYQHKGWEIDSDSADPLYTSYEDDRFALWRWNPDPASLEAEDSNFMHFRAPPHPKVFATDMPGALSLLPPSPHVPYREAVNSTVEFRTCLFKLADLPETTDKRGRNIDFGKAIRCFEWSSKYVYDFASRLMTSPQGIDPVCAMEE